MSFNFEYAYNLKSCNNLYLINFFSLAMIFVWYIKMINYVYPSSLSFDYRSMRNENMLMNSLS